MLNALKRVVKKVPSVRKLLVERDELRDQVKHLRNQLAKAVQLNGISPSYDSDGMRLYCKSVAFMKEEAFLEAYRAGMNSGHAMCRPFGSQDDIHWEWRVHMLCWAARHAQQLPGDFVECGVNTGIFSLAICHYIPFNETGKSFFLFDTFNGIPEDQMLPAERPRALQNNLSYPDCYELARRNFAPFPRAQLIRGKVPETLSRVPIEKVCYLSIDMNIAAPEVAALDFFWDKLVPGAIVVLDDYGHSSYGEQREALDAFAIQKGVAIATLPTGQGLLLKA
jgi:O-methyltransferase